MRKALLVAGSTLVLAIAAPALAKTDAVRTVDRTVAHALPKGSVPSASPRVSHSARPSLRVRAPVSNLPLASGQTSAQVKAPRNDTHIVKVKTSATRGLTGSGLQVSAKHNGVQVNALGHGQGVNTRRALGVPLTASANGKGGALGGAGNLTGKGGLLASTNNLTGKTLGASPAASHGVVGANLVRNPSVINRSGTKH